VSPFCCRPPSPSVVEVRLLTSPGSTCPFLSEVNPMKAIAPIRGILSLGLAVALTVPAVATLTAAQSASQMPENHKAMMHDALQETVNQLNLTDDQKAKMKDIFSDAKTKRESIWKDASLSQDQKKEQMKALHADTKAKVNEVLTPDQRTQLKEKMEAMKAHQPQ